MLVYTNAPDYARKLLGSGDGRPSDATWRYVLVSGFAAESQYGRLIRRVRSGARVPDGLVCVARTGDAFQGFRNRSWAGSAGNIHLAAHLAPGRPVERFGTAFMALAAVSVVEAIDSVPGLAGLARIKWVNDVLLNGAKVAGVLAHSQTRGDAVTCVILGIGLNVETTPAVRPTAFVPAVTSVREHVADPSVATEGLLLGALLRALGRNYRSLLARGSGPIMERYRARSAVLGQQVLISADEPDEVPRVLAAGRVVEVGDGLELRLEGRTEAITSGRLIMTPAARAPYLRAS